MADVTIDSLSLLRLLKPVPGVGWAEPRDSAWGQPAVELAPCPLLFSSVDFPRTLAILGMVPLPPNSTYGQICSSWGAVGACSGFLLTWPGSCTTWACGWMRWTRCGREGGARCGITTCCCWDRNRARGVRQTSVKAHVLRLALSSTPLDPDTPPHTHIHTPPPHTHTQTNAVSTFNVLNQEGRKVVGALLPLGADD